MTAASASALALPLIPSPALIVMMGAPGAGKSTLARSLAVAVDAELHSYDECRKEIPGSFEAATEAAVVVAHSRVRRRCEQGLMAVIDGTHSIRKERVPLLEMAAEYHLPAILVAVLTGREICLARQLLRAPTPPGAVWGEQVPPEVVRTKHAAVMASLPGLHIEGWHSVHLLNTHHLVQAAA